MIGDESMYSIDLTFLVSTSRCFLGPNLCVGVHHGCPLTSYY